jgi:5'-3' exonuclease
MASSFDNVLSLVVAEDTDVLALLLYHATGDCTFYMKTKENTISINVAKHLLGREFCMRFPFVHAMSGCDTTSKLYSIGKIKNLKLLQSLQKWRSNFLVFGDSSVSLQEVADVGELFIRLYTVMDLLSQRELTTFFICKKLPQSIFSLNTYHPQAEHISSIS